MSTSLPKISREIIPAEPVQLLESANYQEGSRG
jgi:hypothetical protein